MEKITMRDITRVHNAFDYQIHLDQPEELYHYTSLGTLQQILGNRQLRFTNRAYLNDKTEGVYVLSLCKKKINELWPWDDNVGERNTKEAFCKFLDNTINEFYSTLFQSYQVSFSYKADSLSMWNYYAQGQGCNIQFSNDFMESFRSRLVKPREKSLAFLYGNVIYDESQQLNILQDIFKAFEPFGKYQAVESLYYCLTQSILKIGSFFKPSSFEDERECRIVFNLSMEKNSNVFKQIVHPESGFPYKCGVYSKQGMLVPYVDIKFDLKYIQGITVSPTSDFEKVKQGIRIMLYEQGVGSAFIKKSNIPLRF